MKAALLNFTNTVRREIHLFHVLASSPTCLNYFFFIFEETGPTKNIIKHCGWVKSEITARVVRIFTRVRTCKFTDKKQTEIYCFKKSYLYYSVCIQVFFNDKLQDNGWLVFVIWDKNVFFDYVTLIPSVIYPHTYQHAVRYDIGV